MLVPAYSNSGDQNSASYGQTSTQMPQYMHSEKSIANRSSALRTRGRPRGPGEPVPRAPGSAAVPGASGTGSLCEEM